MGTDLLWIEALGFKVGKSGAHSARSLMIEELSILLDTFPEGATVEKLKEEIITFNLLRKPTANSRRLTYRHLLDLYALSDDVCLFRAFRKLWNQAPSARPVLALQLALCRDPLLRLSLPKMLDLKPGETVVRQDIELLLEQHNPDYSEASLKSFAQNINGSWTQSGFLQGRSRKVRAQPQVDAANIAFALFIAYLQGMQGQRALTSVWCKLLSQDIEQLHQLARAASIHAYISYKNSGDVVDVTFPGWMNDKDKELLHG